MAEKSFPFIVFNGPKLEDPSARRVIRKQAMRDVGNARKKRGNYGKVNMRQMPVFNDSDAQVRSEVSESSRGSSESLELTSSDTSDSTNSSEATEYEEIVPSNAVSVRKKLPLAVLRTQDPLSYMAVSLFSNYETARAKFMVDVTDLSILTNFNIGKGTISILAADPARLASLLGHYQWSYLQFIPSLYGSSECLTAATNCLLAKVKTTLYPKDQCKDTTLRLYTKALRTLQNAISNEDDCMDADVLCAMQLLSLHELLDPSRDAAWSHHIDGSARLVKHRTPDKFTTEFDKALFAAHAGPALSEALMGNTHCYLQEPKWITLYQSLIQESDCLNDRSSLAVNIRSLMFPVPGLWHDIGEAVTGTQLFDDHTLASLIRRCREAHQGLIDWMEDYKGHCVRMSFASPPPQELSTRRELFGTALECLCIVKRLLATVCDSERPKLEAETQALAHLILDLQKQPSPKHSWLFTGHEVGVAYTAMLTKEEWEGRTEYDSDYERRIASRTRYNTWSNVLRMSG